MIEVNSTQRLELPNAILIETLVTTLNEEGTVNLSPMGPIVDWPITRLLLRPYRTSQTYLNLKRTGQGVMNITDDVELIAQAAIDSFEKLPQFEFTSRGAQPYLTNACRWYHFEVVQLDDSAERTEIECRVVASANLRDFLGFNRAKHAVIELAILATRLKFLPSAEIAEQIVRLRPLVEKTGSQAEHRALQLLESFIHDHWGDRSHCVER